MDEELREKIMALTKRKWWKPWKGKEMQIAAFNSSFYEEGEKAFVLITTSDGKGFEHELKDISVLFCGEGKEVEIEGREDEYTSLLSSIESAISGYYKEHPGLLDRNVIFALHSLIKNPEGKYPFNDLRRDIQLNLRFCLSLKKWSRQEVISCLRYVLRSVKLHRSVDGPRGYLDFIVNFI